MTRDMLARYEKVMAQIVRLYLKYEGTDTRSKPASVLFDEILLPAFIVLEERKDEDDWTVSEIENWIEDWSEQEQ